LGVNIEANHELSARAELGEGPVWRTAESALWFVDVSGKRIHRYAPAPRDHNSWPAPEKCSFIVPIRGGGFLVGLKTGLHRFDPAHGTFSHFASVEPHLAANRLNDGAVDAQGTLWFGSMHDGETDASGSLFRLDRGGELLKLDTGYIVSNGPAFSPCGNIFYHTDSANRVVYAFDRTAAGEILNKRVFVTIEASAGYPDGTTIDAEGCLWIALWRGWEARRYSPRGELLSTIRFPCANVTKLALGGEDLQTAYVTTAARGLSSVEREAQPLAGDVFSFRVQVPGLPGTELDLALGG
jgi:xylono-1,5-lactonase